MDPKKDLKIQTASALFMMATWLFIGIDHFDYFSSGCFRNMRWTDWAVIGIVVLVLLFELYNLMRIRRTYQGLNVSHDKH